VEELMPPVDRDDGEEEHVPSVHDERTTVRIPVAASDAAAVASLQALLPKPLPISGPRPVVTEAEVRHDTPHTFVLPATPPPDRATLTVLAGESAGRTFAVGEGATILGRGLDSTIPIDEISVSRHHARITRGEDGRYVLEDLGSTNGTFLGARRVEREPLRSGDRLQLGPHCVLRFALVDEAEETLQKRLYESASRDTLTGLANRRTLFERLASAIAHAQRHHEEIGLLMIDLDHFKQVNDAFGHLAGDQVLRALAMASQQVLRGGDLLARYGGEELTVLARETTKLDAVALAERLRSHLAGVQVEVGSGAVHVTVSIGIAVLSECGPSKDAAVELVALADARLYAAKQAGRDQVCAEE
jgi:diguanylate cyclase (GGDEF)-like protein